MLLAVRLVLGRVFVLRSVRIFFTKTDKMKFVSHLDFNRFMIRMIRKSKIPVWYSEGFNPHPYITFALPLSLGFESSYEVMDIRLEDDHFKNEEVLKALSCQMPKGIKLLEASNPIMKSGEVAFASFCVDFSELSQKMSEDLYNFLSSEHIFAEKKTKKGAKKILDLKEYIKSFEIKENNLLLTLAAGGSNNLNPKLLLEEFNKKSEEPLPPSFITRTMLYNEKMERFA